jgi:hypothetical protein
MLACYTNSVVVVYAAYKPRDNTTLTLSTTTSQVQPLVTPPHARRNMQKTTTTKDNSETIYPQAPRRK